MVIVPFWRAHTSPLLIIPFSCFLLLLVSGFNDLRQVKTSGAKRCTLTSVDVVFRDRVRAPVLTMSLSPYEGDFLSPDQLPKEKLVPSKPTIHLFPSSSKFSAIGQSEKRRWLVIDFDGTCTEHDTTPLLPRLAAFVQHRCTLGIKDDRVDDKATSLQTTGRRETHYREDLERRLSLFEKLENEFMRRYSEAQSSLWSHLDHHDNYITGNRNIDTMQQHERDSDTIIKKKVQPTIYDVLDELDQPSNIVTQMVSDSGVLQGLGYADATDLEAALTLHGISAAKDSTMGNITLKEPVEQIEERVDGFDEIVVRLKSGCEATLANALTGSISKTDVPRSINKVICHEEENNVSKCLCWNLAVLSVNWCPALIEASLVRPILRRCQHILLGEKTNSQKEILHPNENDHPEITVWSNNVDGQGVITLDVPGAIAKRDRIVELRKCLNEEKSTTEAYTDESCADGISNKNLIVYVGDSSTDLAALIEADIGILMGKSLSVARIAEHWGINIRPLRNRDRNSFECDGHDRNNLWQVESWEEIGELLLELDKE